MGTYFCSLRLLRDTRMSVSIEYSWHMMVVQHYSADH